MTRYVTDTHALVWHLQSNPHLSETARDIFRDADAGNNQVLVPSIVLVEMVYLAERKRIEQELVTKVFNALTSGSINYRVAPLDAVTARTVQSIDPNKIPEMPDRIIAATAKRLDLLLITRDLKITNSGLVTVVW